MINQKKLGKFLDKWGSIVIFSVMILAFCVMADNFLTPDGTHSDHGPGLYLCQHGWRK